MELVHSITFLLGVCTLVSADWDTDPRCPRFLPDTTVTVTNNGKCYQFVDKEVYWPKADAYCRKYGGRMLTINDPDTNDFIVWNLNAIPWRNRGVWLGLHDRNGEMNWEWTTENEGIGETVRYTNWARGHPKAFLHTLRDCVRMIRGRGTWRWHEIFCSSLRWKYKFICQYEMTPTTTTTTTELPTVRRGDTAALHRTITARRLDKDYNTDHEEQWVGNKHEQRQGPQPTPSTRRPTSTKQTTIQYGFQNDVLEHVIMPQRLEQKEVIPPPHKAKTPGVTVAVVACMVGVLAAVLLVAIIYVKRRNQDETEDETLNNPTYATDVCENNNVSPATKKKKVPTATLR